MNSPAAGKVPVTSGGPQINLRSPILFLKIAVSAGVLAILFWWLPVEEIMAGISSVPVWVWLFCLAGFAIGHVISALKWRVLLTGVGVPTEKPLVLKAHGAGLFANLCLPSIVGGDFVRAAMVVKDKGKIEQVTVASLADRLIDTLVLVIIAIVAMAVLPERYMQAAAEGFKYVPLIVTFCLTFLMLAVAAIIVAGLIPEHYYPRKLHGVVAKIQAATTALTAAPSTALIAFILSMVVQCGFILLNILIAYGVGISLPAVIWFAAWPLAKLIALVPISIGGVGVREAALMSLLVPFGVSGSAAVAQALSWQAVLWATGLIAGAVIAMLTYYSKTKSPVQYLHQGESD